MIHNSLRIVSIALFLITSMIMPVRAEEENSPNSATTATHQKELENVRSKIRNLEVSRKEIYGQADKLQDELRENELEAASTLQRLQDLRKQIQIQEDGLHELGKQQQLLREQLTEKQKHLGTQVRSAFLLGQHSYLRLLFNQENLIQLDRMLTWHAYYTQQHSQKIATIRERLAELNTIKTSIDSKTKLLQTLQTQENIRLSQHSQARKSRQKIIAALEQQINSQDEELELLRENEYELTTLLEQLLDTGSATIEQIKEADNFAKLRGTLAWPVDGEIIHEFGKPHKKNSTVRWQGVLIDTPLGSEVHAVGNGKVVFADWFQGKGLLLIIEHSHSYMSLYGHNQLLLKRKGDWVLAGEAVATTGDSGGQDRPGLYFELRENGKALDPANWCVRDQ